ncbi:recombinase family protein [Paraclostridium ghonii]|uniref:recombinase family protein n=1 Tax=Paraclostridium ghonii TaxID=29358 RepID=UPI00202CB6DA|nr:recombinase family protein [Paeniclostridium ghonii]MCM0167042.1 recombinase family protein [Paeniclostridium ghonii]
MIVRARKKYNLTQSQLAKRCKITQSYLSKLESFEHVDKLPTLRLVIIIAKELNLNPHELASWFIDKDLKNKFKRSTELYITGGELLKTAIYLRKSRADEDSDTKEVYETLSRHRSTLLKIAREQNLNIVEIKEEVVSGESIEYRPKMIELLDEVKNGFYDAVLVMDIDRLGRGNMQDQGLILETFKKSKTKIITPRKTYDLTNEFDEEYSEFEAFMARKELKLITRRMQRGRVKSIEEGKYIASQAPYGYKFTFDENGKKSMVIDDEKADIVKLVFDLYVNKGYGGRRIASHLNALGLKTSRGRTWYDKGVRDIIKNKTYAGYVVWNRVERGKTTSRTRDLDERIESKGIHEPIISESIWNKAQIRLAKNEVPRNKKDTTIANPLAGLVICTECGYKMLTQQSTYSGGSIVKFVKCKECGMNRSIKLDTLENEVINQLKLWVNSYKTSFDAYTIKPKENGTLKEYNKLLKTLETEYETLSKQKENLHNLLEQGIYDVDTYLDRSKALSEKIELNRQSIKLVNKDIEAESKASVSFADIIPKIEKVLELYPKTDVMKERNELLKRIIDRIEYYREPGKRSSKPNIKIYPKLKNK